MAVTRTDDLLRQVRNPAPELVYAFNERSIRFHEALGFRFEGRLRNMVYTNGAYYDELYFGLTCAEWDQIDPPMILERFSARDEITHAS